MVDNGEHNAIEQMYMTVSSTTFVQHFKAKAETIGDFTSLLSRLTGMGHRGEFVNIIKGNRLLCLSAAVNLSL